MAIASAMVSAEAAEPARASPARETAASQRLRRRMIISNPQKPDARSTRLYDLRFHRRPVDLTLSFFHPDLTIRFPAKTPTSKCKARLRLEPGQIGRRGVKSGAPADRFGCPDMDDCAAGGAVPLDQGRPAPRRKQGQPGLWRPDDGTLADQDIEGTRRKRA